MTTSDTAAFDTILHELMQARAVQPNLLQFGSLLSAHQYLRAYALVRRYVLPGSQVLDWGTGNGHFSYFLIRSGYHTTGLDFFGTPTICAPFEPEQYSYQLASADDPVHLPLADGTFDAVVSIGVLEHVREGGGSEQASLLEIARVLRPGGVFICFHLPNRYSWIEFVLRRMGRWSHQYRFTAGDIRHLCAGAGLQPVMLQRYALLPRNIWWWKLRRFVRNEARFASAYDRLDDLLGRLAAPICQNYLFVARRPELPH